MNPQVISSPDGEIIWVPGPLPGATHDLRAARIWAILRELAASGLIVLADKGYTGAGEHAHVPTGAETSPPSCKDANRAHARLRSRATAPAQLKTSHILRKHPCCLRQAGQLAKAIHVLQTREIEDEKHSVFCVGRSAHHRRTAAHPAVSMRPALAKSAYRRARGWPRGPGVRSSPGSPRRPCGRPGFRLDLRRSDLSRSPGAGGQCGDFIGHLQEIGYEPYLITSYPK
jgi:hypothetical protein